MEKLRQKRKRLFLVKREIYAFSMKEALNAHGMIYEIQLADDKFQPDLPKKDLGFQKNK